MERPNRKEYINKKTRNQLIADLELYIDYLENTYITSVKKKRYNREEIENLATKDFKALIPYPTNIAKVDVELKKWIKKNL
jgi:ribosome-associated toxin RatA of RatAB toxin-antitoxin module